MIMLSAEMILISMIPLALSLNQMMPSIKEKSRSKSSSINRMKKSFKLINKKKKRMVSPPVQSRTKMMQF